MKRSLSEGRALQVAESDTKTATTATTASTFGTLLNSLVAELASVLSSNPFALNLGESTVILSFMGSLVGFILIALVFLLRLDHNERIQKIYVKKEQRVLAAKLLEEDMKSGGKGDLGESFKK
jgi:glycerol-3-phosphate acyltransferase PlsY